MEILKETENKIDGVVGYLKEELMGMRTNRPSPRLVEDITLEVYGQKMTIKQVGAISIQPPMSIVISIWDKSVVSAVAKAIENSNLNVMANVDGANIRINLPQLTDERRAELIKIVKREVEDSKIKIRTIREESNKKISKDADDGLITEDEKFSLKEKVQEIVDRKNKDIDVLLENKIREIHE